MSDVAVEDWLKSRKFADIEGLRLCPKESPAWRSSPLEEARGQATVYHLRSDDGKAWVLKKFVPAKLPNRTYISAIQPLVPVIQGFESGFQRKVLEQRSLAIPTQNSNYFSSDLALWLENTVLMPYVLGKSWAAVADEVRDGKLYLTREQRIELCQSLIAQVKKLEDANVSHRDLSSQNVFIDAHWKVHLIDWDSLYHTSLVMPMNTTYGTDGYIAPFVNQDIRRTWCKYSDRFSMAVLLAKLRLKPTSGDATAR